MGLIPLTDAQEIEKAFNVWSKQMRHQSQAIPNRFVGWKGGHDRFTVYWHPDEGIWSLFDEGDNRYWCCFGTKDPQERGNLSITCEINVPFEGFDRRIAALFGRADDGNLYLAHSGKIAGGRLGIGKEAFLNSYRGKNWDTVFWPDGKESDVIVIGRLDGQSLPAQITHFVREVERFKRTVTVGGEVVPPTFKPEFSGTRRGYRVKGRIEAQCNHGLIISALAAELEKCGLIISNDSVRDLFIPDNGKIKILFEAKTDTSTTSIYRAIGQLMFHGATQNIAPKRVMVLPELPKKQTQEVLERLGIDVLTYSWSKNQPVFENIGLVLKSLL